MVAPAAVIVTVTVFQLVRLRRRQGEGQIVDLTDAPVPAVDLDFLRARAPEAEWDVQAPVTSEVSLGARLLAADRNAASRRVVVHQRRQRGEPLVPDR